MMFPVLVFMYVRSAHTEEREALAEFGDEYARYMREVPGFFRGWPISSVVRRMDAPTQAKTALNSRRCP